MICESCHQNLATVHLTEIVQKYKKETHLCEECARTRGVPYKNQLAKDPLSAKKEEPVVAPPPAGELAEPCPSCGTSFSDFRASGRLGCPHDYEQFKRGLVPLLEKIHGAVQHTGRIPARVGARIERQRLIAALQRDLSQAVEREEYERAAEVRDKIRALEQQQVEEPST
ncbi:MAG: UvrB/UvrC motif-containing protein [Planctomycetota bacterium]|nr:UvrB/UvrC motif-containing protein [Planctomycetota bacterium]